MTHFQITMTEISNNNNNNNQPITFNELLDRCMGELEFAQKVLENFISTCEPQLAGLRDDLEKRDWTAISRKVHRFKGTAATIAAMPLRKSLEALEALVETADENRIEETRHSIERAASECDRIHHYVTSGMNH
jgi:HPt (histidine-containing phosphotransfer) domain-containing protein